MGVELIGMEGAKRMIGTAISGVSEPAAALRPEFRVLEEAERGVFDSLHGRYVLTGRTERSLTEPEGLDAIRFVHGTTLIFGSAVFYSRFLTKDETGDHHTGGSAVLVNVEAVMGPMAARVLKRMVEGQ